MCLTIKAGTSEMIAEEDMTVYKVIRIDDNTSQMRGFPYEPGARYTLSPADSVEFNRAGFKWPASGWRQVYEGFHAYITKEAAYHNVLALKVVSFTIPKGAKYYLGVYEEIVSDSIIAGDLTAL